MFKVKVLLGVSAIIAVIVFVFWDVLLRLDVHKYQVFSLENYAANKYQVFSEETHATNKYQVPSLENPATNLPGNTTIKARSKYHQQIQEIFKDRTDKIHKVCAEEKSKIPANVTIKDMVWSIEEKHKLLMCRTAKHGSTTWSSNFVQIYTNGKMGGSQIKLRKLEGRATSLSKKLDSINSLRSADHDLLSFFVCRNPVEKLLSVYNFLLYQTQENGKTFAKFPTKNPPSWEEYISKVANGMTDGLSDSVFQKCSVCTFHYDAVIKMETFDHDSR